MADVNTRPNIRIEIKNNVNESMDIDEETINISEEEEGEINDKNDEQEENLQTNNDNKSRGIWAKFDDGTTTKTSSDAKRQLESVYASLNVKELWNTVRLDAVHMRGIGDMNTLDILKYFLTYAPTAIEWVDETSCNILWADMPIATKALYQLSKAIVGSKDDGYLEETMDLDRQNNGLQNKHRVVEIRDDCEDAKATDKENNKEIHIRYIKDDIPEGAWRLGNESMKAKFIFLRFALTTDKQPIRAEHFTEYYKQCGVIENGNNLGIISQSRKRKFLGIFDRNRDLSSCEDSLATKNPWGPLAESWYQDFVHTEPEYKTSTLLTSERLESVSNLQHRLGFKRAHLDSQNIEDTENGNDENQVEIIEIRSDLEESIASEEHTSRKLLEKRLKLKSPKKKKSKLPRMRMYADEEEAKIKRKKSLQSLKKKLSQKKKLVEEILEEEVVESNDLRNMIGKRTILKPKRRMENMVLVVKQEPGEEETNSGRHMEDLGNKLKHRHMTRLNEAAAKNSVHLRLHGIQTVSTSYQDEDTYDVHEPEPETLERTITTIRKNSTSSSSLIPRGATLHSDSIITTSIPTRNQSTTPSGQHHRSPDRLNHHHHHHRGDRSDRDGRVQREGRHSDMDRLSRFDGLTSGRMHSDREEYRNRRSSRRGEYTASDRGGRRQRRDVEEEEIERVERKGAKSKVMIVVKKPAQPTVASMAILPRPSSNINQSRSLSTTALRVAHHRRHDNVRLTTRDSNQLSSSDSSSEDDSSSGSSSSSSEDDSSSESGSGSGSDSSESSESSESDSDDMNAVGNNKPKGGSVVRGARTSIKDRVGVNRENPQGNIRVQIKNEHYGK